MIVYLMAHLRRLRRFFVFLLNLLMCSCVTQILNEHAKCFSQAIPSWVWFTIGILLFVSHTLDGIDGKQARRTGSSSPLGELFDHGCDGWAMVLTTSTFYDVFGQNSDGFSISPIRMYAIFWCIFTCFHVSHWEKYNTGIMYLPWTSGIRVKYILLSCL